MLERKKFVNNIEHRGSPSLANSAAGLEWQKVMMAMVIKALTKLLTHTLKFVLVSCCSSDI